MYGIRLIAPDGRRLSAWLEWMDGRGEGRSEWTDRQEAARVYLSAASAAEAVRAYPPHVPPGYTYEAAPLALLMLRAEPPLSR